MTNLLTIINYSLTLLYMYIKIDEVKPNRLFNAFRHSWSMVRLDAARMDVKTTVVLNLPKWVTAYVIWKWILLFLRIRIVEVFFLRVEQGNFDYGFFKGETHIGLASDWRTLWTGQSNLEDIKRLLGPKTVYSVYTDNEDGRTEQFFPCGCHAKREEHHETQIIYCQSHLEVINKVPGIKYRIRDLERTAFNPKKITPDIARAHLTQCFEEALEPRLINDRKLLQTLILLTAEDSLYWAL